MKLVKQPVFLAGIGAIVLAIVLAIVGTVVNPSSAVVDKFEKAMNKKDAKMLQKCFSPTLSQEALEYATLFTSLESFTAGLTTDGEIEYEMLVGEAEELDLESEHTVKQIPCVMVFKSNGKVIYMNESTQKIVEIDGKEYLYTGQE